MGLFFRKSISFGKNFRINISKSGIGYSYGVRGFRISHGARGTYLNAGMNGVYYCKKISSNNTLQATENNISIPHATYEISNSIISQSELTKKLNNTTDGHPLAIISTIFSIFLFAYIFMTYDISHELLQIIFAVFATTSIVIFFLESKFKIINLNYEVESDTHIKLLELSLNFLKENSVIWQITQEVEDVTINIVREKLYFNYALPQYIKSNYTPNCLKVYQLNHPTILYFMPDCILLQRKDEFSQIRYEDIAIKFNSVTFTEEEDLPADATIKAYQWLYSNKDGSPNKRYSNNYQIPITKYIRLTIYHIDTEDLILYLLLPNIEKTLSFINKFNSFLKEFDLIFKRQTARFQEDYTYDSIVLDDDNESDPYIILGVPISASRDEIKSAYRKLVQIYHPDKFNHLSQEFVRVADRKFKKIKKAYEEILNNS